MIHRFLTPLLTALVVVFLALPAGAQQSALYDWASAPAEAQLQADTTAIQAGNGAIFVPALTTGSDEPEVNVYSGEERVVVGRTGKRIELAPGTYVVRIGSGALNQRSTHEVVVSADKTELVAVNWGGLRLEVVDENNIPHRGNYELIRESDREVLGIGYGADSLQGERLQTWLLEPGLYRVIRRGETYRARRDFLTVDVPEGGLVNLKLVLDPVSGQFRGGGVVSSEEIGIAGEGKRWTRRLTLGGAANLASTSNLVGTNNQSSLGGQVFADAFVTYENGRHNHVGIFELEEGVIQIDPEVGKKLPTQTTQDRLRADWIYTNWRGERWGPYARFGLLTNVFASDVLATEDSSISFRNLDGSRDVFFVPANQQYRTADSFGSLRIREGVGVNFRLVRNRWATVNWRVGAGLRQNLFNNAFVLDDDPSTPQIEYFEIDEFNQEGAETTISGNVRLARNLLYVFDLEGFGDFDDFSNPTIDWRNTLSLRLTRTIALDYTLDLLDQPQVSDHTQSRQNILLRFSWDIL